MTRPDALPFATAVETARRRNDLLLPAATLAKLADLATRITYVPAVPGAASDDVTRPTGGSFTALFVDPSGTGKTMAAEVLATDSGRLLYRVDLGNLVSKYIGETEKNLRRLLAAAEHRNVILLFDEADGLFDKRAEVKDAHDRYANIEVSYLLQQL